MDCIFCKIVAGEIPSYKVYEDNDFFAFLDNSPLNPGHTLVIPKKHHRWVWDVPADKEAAPNIGDYYLVVGRLAQAIKKAFSTDYVVSLVFGEAVPHAHVWLVPRFENDGHGAAIDLGNVKKLSHDEMEEVQRKIVENI